MQKIEYTTIDKTGWADGPWQYEPDKIQWPDSETGLPCLAKRHPTSGHWCGYVGVSADHPCFGKDYDDVDADVHGGLTYADACQEGPENAAICHVPGDGESNNVWWLGFDCAHCDDLSPGRDSRLPAHLRHGSYRDLDYVKAQCAALARQLNKIGA